MAGQFGVLWIGEYLPTDANGSLVLILSDYVIIKCT